ncbi:unnamed protein product [Phaeothamnion confervicola]
MITLRYVAGGRYHNVKNHHHIAKATFYDIIWRIIDAINSADVFRLPGLPVGEEESARAAAGFQRRSRASFAFRGRVSCGRISFFATFEFRAAALVPAAQGFDPPVLNSFVSLCTNRSLLSADSNFLFAFTSRMFSSYEPKAPLRWGCGNADGVLQTASFNTPGSTNDWNTWQEPSASAAVEALLLGYYVIDGNAYPSTERLMVPYLALNGIGSDSDYLAKDAFNFYQSQRRITVERTFGLLVGRWGILWGPLRLDLPNVPRVLSAPLRMHNFSQVRGDELLTPEPGSVEEMQRPLTPTGRVNELFETPRAAARTANQSAMREIIKGILVQTGAVRPPRNIACNRAASRALSAVR